MSFGWQKTKNQIAVAGCINIKKKISTQTCRAQIQIKKKQKKIYNSKSVVFFFSLAFTQIGNRI